MWYKILINKNTKNFNLIKILKIITLRLKSLKKGIPDKKIKILVKTPCVYWIIITVNNKIIKE